MFFWQQSSIYNAISISISLHYAALPTVYASSGYAAQAFLALHDHCGIMGSSPAALNKRSNLQMRDGKIAVPVRPVNPEPVSMQHK